MSSSFIEKLKIKMFSSKLNFSIEQVTNIKKNISRDMKLHSIQILYVLKCDLLDGSQQVYLLSFTFLELQLSLIFVKHLRFDFDITINIPF